MPFDPNNEQAVVAALRRGDEQALNQIINTWQASLFGFAWRYVRNSTDARDLVSETFVKLYLGRERLREDTHLSAWLYTTLTNLCHNHHRWRMRHPAVSMDTPTQEANRSLAETLPGDKSHPADHLERDEDLRSLAEAIDKLPHDQKTVLLLHHYRQLGYREIAVIVGCSERGVETRLYRAKQRLREELVHLRTPPIQPPLVPKPQGGLPAA